MATSYTAQTIAASGDIGNLSTAVKTLVTAVRDKTEVGSRLTAAEVVVILNAIIDANAGNSTLTMP